MRSTFRYRAIQLRDRTPGISFAPFTTEAAAREAADQLNAGALNRYHFVMKPKGSCPAGCLDLWAVIRECVTVK